MGNFARQSIWIAIAQAVKVFTQVASVFVLARLMSPSEYGLVALVSAASAFAMIFKDLGSSAAIIQSQSIDEPLLSTAFWTNLTLGGMLMVGISLTSPFASNLFNAPSLAGALAALSLAFPLLSSSAVHQALMERSLRFEAVAKIEVAGAFAGLFVAVVAAYCGAGVYSVVLQALCSATISTSLYWRLAKWRPMSPRRWDRSTFSSIIKYSGGIVGFNTVNYLSRNADSIIVGKFLSTQVLGAYSLAYRVMLFPLQSITVVVSRGLFPVISRLQDDKESMQSVYFKSVRVVCFIVAPLMAGLFFIREPFVAIIFGPQWNLTADILAWLAPTGLIQSLMSTTGVVFMATARTRLFFILGVVGAVLQVGAFIIGVRHGVIAMSILYFASNVINSVPVMTCCMRALEASIFDLLKAIWRPLVSASIMLSSLYAGFAKSGTGAPSDLLEVLISIAFGFTIYTIVALLIDRTFCISLCASVMASVKRRKGGIA